MDEHSSLKFVEYDNYCQKCKHEYVVAGEPCDSCMEEAAREGTSKPLYFEEK